MYVCLFIKSDQRNRKVETTFCPQHSSLGYSPFPDLHRYRDFGQNATPPPNPPTPPSPKSLRPTSKADVTQPILPGPSETLQTVQNNSPFGLLRTFCPPLPPPAPVPPCPAHSLAQRVVSHGVGVSTLPIVALLGLRGLSSCRVPSLGSRHDPQSPVSLLNPRGDQGPRRTIMTQSGALRADPAS